MNLTPLEAEFGRKKLEYRPTWVINLPGRGFWLRLRSATIQTILHHYVVTLHYLNTDWEPEQGVS